MTDYYSAKNWRDFVKSKIVPIRDYAEAILNFWNFLKELDGKNISEILKNHPELEIVFLGGVDENGYSENSFAKAIKVIFGAYVIDLKAYFSFVLQDLEPVVPISVGKTWILKCIELIKDIADLIISKVNIDTKANSKLQEYYINNPDKIFEGLQKFVQHCLKICVGFDKYMTFVWNIRKITRRYLELVFPETRNNENFRFLKEFLGLTEIFVPEIDNDELRRDYTIYGFPEVYNYAKSKERVITLDESSTLGGLLLWLNKQIWKLICNVYSDDSSINHGYGHILRRIVFRDVPCPIKLYLSACREELDRIGWDWNKSLYLYNVRRNSEVKIDGDLIKDKDGTVVSKLFGFLDQISPALFLGAYELVFKNRNEFILVER